MTNLYLNSNLTKLIGNLNTNGELKVYRAVNWANSLTTTITNAINMYSIYLFVGVCSTATFCGVYLLWTDSTNMHIHKISGTYDISLSKVNTNLTITVGNLTYWLFSLIKIGNYPGY